MPTLEVFFDYACPYCEKAHRHLLALVAGYPGISLAWRPCEAHPRPERYGPHSDLCIRGMFYVQAQGINLWTWHQRMYDACLGARVDVEDAGALAHYVGDLLDEADFCNALQAGLYQHELQQANHYAYEESGVWVVPAYRLADRRLDAVEDVGVTRAQLAAFLGKR